MLNHNFFTFYDFSFNFLHFCRVLQLVLRKTFIHYYEFHLSLSGGWQFSTISSKILINYNIFDFFFSFFEKLLKFFKFNFRKFANFYQKTSITLIFPNFQLQLFNKKRRKFLQLKETV